MNKIVRVDLTRQTFREEKVTAELRILGGRALLDRLISMEIAPTVHPLSEGNKLVFAPGLFAATPVPSSGRLSIGGKSPLTGGIKEANGGGSFGTKIARLGIKALVLEGQMKNGTSVIVIKKNGLSIEGAEDLKGLGNYEVHGRLREKYGKNAGIVSIGPCGEMRMCASTVAVSDKNGFPSRHCARGGLGAVMGSKKVKAIVVDDQGGSFQKAVDHELFKAAVKESVELIRNNPRVRFFHAFGTAGITPMDQGRGSLPTRNYRSGAFDQYTELSAEKMLELMKQRGGRQGHGCMPGCLTQCSNIFHGPDQKYVTSALEYETLAMLGSNLEIADMDAVARMDYKCDDYGLDTIEIGAAMGVLAETDWFEFGNPKKAVQIIDEIGRGSLLGRILGQGVETTCRVFGIDRVPAVKGQAIPGHSARSMKGLGVTYATSPQGADHTAGFIGENPLSNEGQIERSGKAQLDALLMDTAGFCYFNFLQGNRGIMAKLLNGLHGLQLTEADMLNLAKSALKEEILFNRRAGITEADDRLPSFMEVDPLPPTNAVFNIPKSALEKIFELLNS